MDPDGRTFYSASPSAATLVAVDISNTSVPVPLWAANYDSHGLSISHDGTRFVSRTAYRANRRSPRLIGLRKGRVRYFGVASRSLLPNRRALRRHLRLAGL